MQTTKTYISSHRKKYHLNHTVFTTCCAVRMCVAPSFLLIYTFCLHNNFKLV
eukprot:m.156376 g.156376  ORF g.156376 m.156376 type:complete len:52 (-) comp30989_c0_seq2:2343-2498(-)